MSESPQGQMTEPSDQCPVHPLEVKTAYESVEEWQAAARELFGDDPAKWRFVCPSCGLECDAGEWMRRGEAIGGEEADHAEGMIAFSCVGRLTPGKVAEMWEKPGPCNYAGGGFFTINPVSIKGRATNVFAFAADAT